MLKLGRFRTVITVIAATMLCLIATSMPAQADHAQGFPPTPDGPTHYIDRFSLTAHGDAAAVRGNNQIDRTKMSANWGTGDVTMYDGAYGNSGVWYNTVGLTECSDIISTNGHCNTWNVRLNQSNMSTSYERWRELGCHELGHTAGLNHQASSTSCMIGSGWTSPYFNSHDVGAINASPM